MDPKSGFSHAMLQFLADHVQLVNAFLNAVMVLIWVGYLQIFLISHRQQSRSVIHIDLGAGKGAEARCLVSNLSAATLYVQGIVADLARGGQVSRMVVTERDEIDHTSDNPMAGTDRGPLDPGQTMDIGSLGDLIQRARIRLDEDWTFEQIDSITLTVVAVSGQAERIVGAAKEFRIEHDGASSWFSAQSILTRQLRPVQTRASFDRILREQTFH
ncbi:MAG: hypothetical protein ACK4GT_00930 [Pararhodobacter sp.]